MLTSSEQEHDIIAWGWCKGGEEWSNLPYSPEDIHQKQILESSTIASIERGKETVTDETYCDAYALGLPLPFSSLILVL